MIEKTIMAVGAHADDVELNVGGTLAKYYERGYRVLYVMSTNNMSGCWSKYKPDGTVAVTKPPYDVIMPQRKLEAAAGARHFGAEPIHLDHPQRHYTRADGTVSEVRYGCDRPGCVPPDVPTILTAHENEACVRRVVDLIMEHRPEAILTHGVVQMNPEHVGTMLLVTKAFWQAVEAGYTGALLHWREGHTHLGELNCRWDTFIDISCYWDKKLKAIAEHACQIPNPTRPDFPQFHRARAWGTACGCQYAEVFVMVGRPKLPPRYGDFMTEIIAHGR